MMSIPPTRLVVVDASLATMWLLPELYSVRAMSLARRWVQSGIQTIAPSFMPAEVTNAVHNRVRRGELSLTDALAALTLLDRAEIDLHEEPEIHRRAIAFAHRLNRPTSYDAHYLALAEMRGCEMWTGDERLYNAVRETIAWIRWIGAYQTTGS